MKEIITSENTFRVLSIEDNIKKYTPDLSDNDIKAFVWYNKTLGYPMKGFEKWFIKGTKENVVKVNETTDYLNQQFEPIGKFEKGDIVGKITRFTHKYKDIDYVCVRKIDGSICIVDSSKIETNNSDKNVDVSLLKELVLSNSLFYINGDYVPLHVYTNTDISILNTHKIDDKDYIISNFGKPVYDYQINEIEGTRLNIKHPVKDKSFRISPFSEIARKTLYDDDNGINDSLMNHFLKWCSTLPDSSFELVSKSVFMQRIIRNDRQTFENSTKEEKKERAEQIKSDIASAISEMDKLFSVYIHTALDNDTIYILNKFINENYNRSLLINLSKVPVGFECSSKFGVFDFTLKKVQIEAFKYAVSRNNFCLALTVGFGKTSVCISLLSYFIKSGIIKKPFIVVPKPVLKNWQKEMFGYWSKDKEISLKELKQKGWIFNYGIFTGLDIDCIYVKNLSKSLTKQVELVRKSSSCIILGSYEALEKLYIKDNDIRDVVISNWYNIVKNNKNNERAETKMISTIISSLSNVNKEATFAIDELGVDSMFFDEAHRLKNLFLTVPKNDDLRESADFKGAQSSRALRGFVFSQYINKINGKIGFLTATPFSNSPLEVFSILCFLNYQSLSLNNVVSLDLFRNLFFDEALDYTVDSQNNVKVKSVMKRYKNKQVLYKMLSNCIMYEDNSSKANIKRPCLVQYPNNDIKIILKQSDLQEAQRSILVGERKSIEDLTDTFEDSKPYEEFLFENKRNLISKNKLGESGKILASSRSSAISPFAQSPLMMPYVTDKPYLELYNYSPKIKFTIDCIKNIREYTIKNGLQESGFVIYIGLGVNILPEFKEALNEMCGFKNNRDSSKVYNDGDNEDSDEDSDDIKSSKKYDEVEIIKGSASTDTEDNHRDKVSSLFNKGLVKVILGTDTIKEGINLQNNCATLFILTPTWNSTDITQIQGRIHRQGNRFGYARIITPLVTGTLDSFIYQKYEEKQSRIKDIWENDGMCESGDMDLNLPAEKQKELILNDPFEISKIRLATRANKDRVKLSRASDDYQYIKKGISNTSQYKRLYTHFSSKLPMLKDLLVGNINTLNVIVSAIESDSTLVPNFIKNRQERKDRIALLITYFEDLLIKTNLAIDTGIPVDLINIFKGECKRRRYYISLSYDESRDFSDMCYELGLKNGKRLVNNEEFLESCGIAIDNNYDKIDDDSLMCIYDLISIFKNCDEVEKYQLIPNGLNLLSDKVVLNEFLDNAQKVFENVKENLLNDYEITENNIYENGEYRIVFILNAKQNLINNEVELAKIDLAENNKLAQMGDSLAKYFCDLTNHQLKYSINNVNTDECVIPNMDDAILDIKDNSKTEDLIEDDIISESIDSIDDTIDNNDTLEIIDNTTDDYSEDNINPLEENLKILGNQSIGFRGKIIVSGNKNDVQDYFNNLFATNDYESDIINDAEPVAESEDMPYDQILEDIDMLFYLLPNEEAQSDIELLIYLLNEKDAKMINKRLIKSIK